MLGSLRVRIVGLLLVCGTPSCGKAHSTDCRPEKSDASGSLCAGTGRLTCAEAETKCPPYESTTVDLGFITTAYEGSLPKCGVLDPTAGPGFSFPVRVESVQLKTYPLDGAEQLETWVHLERTDASPTCGLMATFRSLIERPRIEPAMQLRIASRIVNVSHTGGTVIELVAMDSGELLYAEAMSVSVANFVEDFGDLVPGLQVGAEGKALCTDLSGRGALRATFAVGSERCSVDSQSSRCCNLWGRSYEVDVLQAVSTPGSDQVQVGFALRADGFFYRPN